MIGKNQLDKQSTVFKDMFTLVKSLSGWQNGRGNNLFYRHRRKRSVINNTTQKNHPMTKVIVWLTHAGIGPMTTSNQLQLTLFIQKYPCSHQWYTTGIEWKFVAMRQLLICFNLMNLKKSTQVLKKINRKVIEVLYIMYIRIKLETHAMILCFYLY